MKERTVRWICSLFSFAVAVGIINALWVSDLGTRFLLLGGSAAAFVALLNCMEDE